MEKMEELYARLSYEARLYKNQLTLLQKEIEKLTLTSLDTSNALRTIQSLQQGDVLVPVGGGSFVKGIVTDNKVLLGIGSGYVIEVDKETAAKKIKEREDATKETINKIAQEYSKVLAKFEAVSKQLQDLETQIMLERRGKEVTREDYV